MKEPIRVLQVLGGTNLGGAESRVMDSYRHMDRDKIQFDFCVHTEERGFFDEEIERLGGHVYRVPRFRVLNWVSYRKAWKDFFQGASGIPGCAWPYDEHGIHLSAHCQKGGCASYDSPCKKRRRGSGNEGKDNPFSAPESGEKGGSLPDLFQTGRRGGVWGEDGTGGTGSYGA